MKGLTLADRVAQLTPQEILTLAEHEEWLTVAELARYFRWTERQARHLLRKGAIPFEKHGSLIRIPSTVVIEAAARRVAR